MKGKGGSLFPFSCYSFLYLIRGLGARVEMRKSFSGKKGNYPYVFHLNTSDIVNKLGVSGTGRSLLYVKIDLMKLSPLSTLRFVLVLRHCSENLMTKDARFLKSRQYLIKTLRWKDDVFRTSILRKHGFSFIYYGFCR